MQSAPTNPRGFTLIELLVAVSMIAIISTYVIVDYVAAQRHADVRLYAYQVASFIRQAQNYSLGAYENAGAVPEGGWGVYIVDGSTYRFFADDGDYVFDAGDAVVEEKTLRHTVEFAVANYGDSLVFEPPNPTTYINGTNQGELTITLRQVDDASNTNTITVNVFGLVDVD